MVVGDVVRKTTSEEELPDVENARCREFIILDTASRVLISRRISFRRRKHIILDNAIVCRE
uniref:Uncharacterized protein n=1 Tax=Cucumis melo TaxID=3656 RepID=A0A9I9CPW6_CUCME